MKNNVVGVDACKFGWCIASGIDSPRVHLIQSLVEARDLLMESGINLIDMPMGLPDSSHLRSVETKARKIVPGKSASIFGVPSRKAVYSSSYKEAKAKNKLEMGKSISIQSWNIVPKIKALDQIILQTDVDLLEAHPEICFHFLNKENDILPSKKSVEGTSKRIQILANWFDETEKVYQQSLLKYKRKDVAKDDVLDALCLWVVAKLSVRFKLHSISNEKDALDILMSMHFVDPFNKRP